MAELHEALKQLGGVDWDDVPQDEALEQYMTECFRAGELLCNSIPPQPSGTPFADSKPHHHEPNSSKSHKEMHPSAARSHPPHKDHEDLQKNWGKPVKLKPADNPLQVSIYKMAGKDRHGAWFARRSIHEGLGFNKWKRAMMREFSESMSVSGGPGAGAIRGIAADRRLEQAKVPGAGKLEVYELSAQFPGPVTPRDFLALVMSTDDALTDKSAAEVEGGKKHVPRHFMVLSRPVEHPDAPLRSGYVRGHYESVEMIREIPLSTAKSKSTPDLLSTNHETEQHTRDRSRTVAVPVEGQGNDLGGDPELNPVEWIMITRSDPGGGIPRFLVDRGTPEAMITDMHKFFDWACSLDHIPDPDDHTQTQQTNSEQEAKPDNQTSGVALARVSQEERVRAANAPVPGEAKGQQPDGIMSSLTKAIGAGFDTYAPTSVSNMVHSQLNLTRQLDSSGDDSSDTTSVDSFMSAEELRRLSTAPEVPEGRANDSMDNLSVTSAELLTTSKDSKDLNNHEKEVLKLARKREKLEQQLAKKRLVEQEKMKQNQEKEQAEAEKQNAEIEKKLKKTEEKHRKEIEKLEAKKAKEARKAEEKKAKKDDQYKMSLVTRERDEFRSQSDIYRRENDLLREQVADLQAQNNALAQKVTQLGGQDALKNVLPRLGHGRSTSMRSVMSNGSSDSVSKTLKKDAIESTAS